MRILIAHNYYQQPGGEDAVFEAEAALLQRLGHHVTRFTVHNDSIGEMSRCKLAAATVWNHRVCGPIQKIIASEKIQIAHFHNTFPLISPAAYAAARSAGAAVVQTIHNHRLICLNALLFRDGKICDDCAAHAFAWRGVCRGCYRNSRRASAVTALATAFHHTLGTWRRHVDLFIAPSTDLRNRLCALRLPAAKTIVKPHFVDPDPLPGPGDGNTFVFLGRLSPEKGLSTLLRAWGLLQPGPELKVIGDGPLAAEVRACNVHVQWLGRLAADEALEQVGRAAALIFPSECLETFGRVIAEAFAKGTPVIASRLGPARGMICEGVNGMFFEPGDAHGLARCVRTITSQPAALREMRRNARAEFERLYTARSNYEQLIAIYERALSLRIGQKASADSDDELGRWPSQGHAAGRTAGAL